MKIFAVSDIHSFYTPLKKALDEAGFEPGNEEQLLIVCGDCFDRGDESQQVLDYLMSVPNKMLIRGNHESLIEQMCRRKFPYSNDFSNGTHKTVCDLAPNATEFGVGCSIAIGKLRPLLDQMVDYYEIQNYIFVHSWIPIGDDWRTAHHRDWEDARWINPFEEAVFDENMTGKIIVHGHWHNSAGWAAKGEGSEWGEDAKFDIVEHNNCIGLDACTAWTNKVNVLVIEDDLLEEI